jgi:transcription antitermination factor NusG
MLRISSLDLMPALAARGLEVEIVRGPLKDVTGIVEDHTKLHEVRLQVNILRQAVLVTVDPSNVKILGDYILEEESL